MERVVFVGAIIFAIFAGLFAFVGGPHFNFGMNLDGGPAQAAIVEVAPGSMAAQSFSGSDLQLRHVAANVTVIPEDRDDYSIEIDNSAGRAPMPEVTVEGGTVLVNGLLRGRIEDCKDDGGVSLRGYGDLSAEELPRITVHAPRSVDVDRSGAGRTEIGAAQEVSLDLSGCSAATIGDVAGELNLDVSGAGTVQAGAARNLVADIAGSAGIEVGAVAEGANIDIAGSGSVTLASLNGDLATDGAGSGNVTIRAGSIGEANIDLAGSGDVTIDAPVRELVVSIVGSGDVDVNAAVGDINADIAGSGGVRARSVSGHIQKEVWGSGDVVVGE